MNCPDSSGSDQHKQNPDELGQALTSHCLLHIQHKKKEFDFQTPSFLLYGNKCFSQEI